jgi:hypothetical protein
MLTKIKNYLLHFLQAQLIVTIVSLPILVSWGMTLSVASFVGNLIFAPILTAFLILSSLIFFTQLLNIPNSTLTSSLNLLTTGWEKLLSLGQKTWLIGFVQTNKIILLAIPVVTFFALRNKKIDSIQKRIMVLLAILILSTGYFYIKNQTQKNRGNQTITNRNRSLDIKQDKNGKINLIDSGFFNTKRSIDKFLDFELKPHILKNYGTLNITNLTLNVVSLSSFKGAIEACKIFNIETVTLPFFKKELSKIEWRYFFILKRELEKNGIEFVRIPASKATP